MEKQWVETLTRERVLMIEDPNSVMDVMLGVIALTSGARDLDGYVKDMRRKEQTKERIEKVVKVLTPYS